LPEAHSVPGLYVAVDVSPEATLPLPLDALTSNIEALVHEAVAVVVQVVADLRLGRKALQPLPLLSRAHRCAVGIPPDLPAERLALHDDVLARTAEAGGPVGRIGPQTAPAAGRRLLAQPDAPATPSLGAARLFLLAHVDLARAAVTARIRSRVAPRRQAASGLVHALIDASAYPRSVAALEPQERACAADEILAWTDISAAAAAQGA